MLKVAMIGFGGIAQAHRYAYWDCNRRGLPIQLVAACDTDLEKFRTITKINLPTRGEITNELPFGQYTDWREMVEKEKPDLVDICLPTKFHEPMTVAVLEAGYSVFCEKPMAENYDQCLHMVDVAKKANKFLMIGQCLRFWPAYEYLLKVVKEHVYGNVLAAEFTRYSPVPKWSKDQWQTRAGKAGSCLAELNIHDIDLVRAAFGNPKQVSCKTQDIIYPYDRADSQFIYEDLTVDIRSAWLGEDTLFNANYKVEFEQGILTYTDDKVIFTDATGTGVEVALPDRDGIMGEIEYLAGIFDQNLDNLRNPPCESAKTIYTLEKLFESAEQDGKLLEFGEGL